MGSCIIYCLMISFMCGRTACTLARDDVVKACSFTDRKGKRKRPVWKNPPGGQQYKTSYNMAPGAFSPVIVSSQHFKTHGAGQLDSDVDHIVMPMKWGLVPYWHKDSPSKVSFKTSNCRGENMLEKATFKIPLHKGQRCVAVMDGFYEWKTTPSGKQPHFFQFSPKGIQVEDKKMIKDEIKAHVVAGSSTSKPEDLSLPFKDIKQKKEQTKVEPLTAYNKEEMHVLKQEYSHRDHSQTEIENKAMDFSTDLTQQSVMSGCEAPTPVDDDESWSGHKLLKCAAVYDIWQPPHASSPLYSYSIITVAASPDMSWCHHRMPAVLTTDEEVCDWLDFSSIPLNQANRLIQPKSACLTSYPVSKNVNNSHYQSEDCLKPVNPSEEKKKLSGSGQMMMSWLKRGQTSSTTDTSPCAVKVAKI